MKSAPTPERRQDHRPRPPKPSIRMFFILIFDKLASAIFGRKWSLVLAVFMFLVATATIFWSLYIRLPVINDVKVLLSKRADANLRLETIQASISKQELQSIEQRISQAQSRIFDSFPDFATWLITKTSLAKKLGFKMDYSIKGQKKTTINEIIAVSTQIDLTVNENLKDKSYVRLLTFLRSFIDENWHLEISGNQIQGQGQGMNKMTMMLSVWLKDNGSINQFITQPEGDDEKVIQ